MFISLLSVYHRIYKGKAFFVNKDGYIITTSIKKSRIIVDLSFFRKRNPNYRRAMVKPSPNTETSEIFSQSSFFGGISLSEEEEEAPL